MNETIMNDILERLDRMAEALEKQAGQAAAAAPHWDDASLWVWQAASNSLKPVTETDIVPLKLLVGLDQQADILMQNTQQFAEGYAANNALLWGARGTGKSALTKAAFQETHKKHKNLNLIEIYREDLASLTALLDLVRDAKDQRFILFCDDLSFDENDSS